MDSSEASLNVDRGIEWLCLNAENTDTLGDWWNYVDLSKLDLSSVITCVWGQLRANGFLPDSYYKALSHHLDDWFLKRGFLSYTLEDDALLHEKWVQRIEELRMYPPNG